MRLVTYCRPALWSSVANAQLSQLPESIDRLLDTPFTALSRVGGFCGDWVPPLDLIEDKDNFVATVEVPGLSKENLNLSVHEGVLSISGERAQPSEPESGEVHRRERVCGRFHRSIALPKPVNTQAITASYRDGVLTVTMPKTEEAKPRQIEVSAN